jgi:hypothetical protein
MLLPDPATEKKGLTGFSQNLLWPEGIVPYVFEFNQEIQEQQLQDIMVSAIEGVNEETNVCWIPAINERKFVRMFRSNRNYNYATVGASNNNPVLAMISRSVGIGQHEMFHSMGVLHEQQRPDRDEHVVIRYSNIQDGFNHNFDKVDSTFFDVFTTGDYDFNSIMHYAPYSFSRNGNPTITRLDGSVDFGQRNRMSPSDIEHINRLYPIPLADCEALVESRTIRYNVGVQMPDNNRESYCPNQAIQFALDAPDRPDQTYTWEARSGNPKIGNGPTFSPSFDTPGSKKITLTVRWGVQKRTETFEVEVDNLPESIRFFGNPIRDGENIRFEVASPVPEYTIFVSSALGQTLFQQEVTNADCRETYSFQTTDMGPGLYTVSVIREGEISSKALIIN